MSDDRVPGKLMSVKISRLVLMCHDAVKKPLQQPYDGPFKVIRHDKNFTVEVKDLESVISIDRLKPAHLDELPVTTTPCKDDPLAAPPSLFTPRVTRSGHQVHWPKRLVTSMFINCFTGGGVM